MTKQQVRTWLGGAALLASVLTLPACAQYGLGGVLPGARSSVVSGEVRSVDTRAGRLYLHDSHGRTETIRFDGRTRAVHNDRAYPLSYLERGDRVRVRVDYDRNGRAWAERVEVRASARDRYDRRDRGRYDDRYERDRDRDRERYKDRGRESRRVERLQGTVLWIHGGNHAFALSPSRDRTYVISVPRGARDQLRRFERLRRGDRVRVEARETSRGQYVLVRFR